MISEWPGSTARTSLQAIPATKKDDLVAAIVDGGRRYWPESAARTSLQKKYDLVAAIVDGGRRYWPRLTARTSLQAIPVTKEMMIL